MLVGFFRASMKVSVCAAGYLLMEKVANFTDADVEKLAGPLRPLVGASQGLQVWEVHLIGLLSQLWLTILILGL